MQIDARGPRFGAAITMVVLLLVIYFDSPILLAIQTFVWAIGAFAGPHKSPYGFIFKKLVKPRLRSVGELENVKPPQFAQLVGFIFGVVGLFGVAIGKPHIVSYCYGFCLGSSFLECGI